VPILRPPLLALGGETAFAAYQTEFDRLYHSAPIGDILGRGVEFRRDACEHVCYKGREEDPYGKLPRTWSQERAERIPWILLALTDPRTEVRPNFRHRERFSYILIIEADPARGYSREFYGVITRPISPGRVEFLTGFPFHFDYWRQMRDGGAPLYPFRPRKPKGLKRKRR
jgi:hypothetical protein